MRIEERSQSSSKPNPVNLQISLYTLPYPKNGENTATTKRFPAFTTTVSHNKENYPWGSPKLQVTPNSLIIGHNFNATRQWSNIWSNDYPILFADDAPVRRKTSSRLCLKYCTWIDLYLLPTMKRPLPFVVPQMNRMNLWVDHLLFMYNSDLPKLSTSLSV